MPNEYQHAGRLSAALKRSRPISKRIQRGDAVYSGNTEENDELLKVWQSVVSGSASVFQTRLALDGLTYYSMSHVLQDNESLDGEEIATVEWLTEVLSQMHEKRHALTSSSSETPFFDLLQPFAIKAIHGLDCSLWSRTAKKQLMNGLTQRLSELASPTLFQEFRQFRMFDDPLSRSEYTRFVKYLLSGGWLDVFEKYPVLARLLAIESRKWSRHLAEVESRIRLDSTLIQRELSISSDGLLPIQGAVPMGDMHDGRCVLALTTANGRRLLYKPRSMMIEGRLNEILDTINRHATAGGLRFGTPRTISCDGYGYQEFIHRKECDDDASVSRAFYNYGGLLGVLHLLGATDGHFENVIVAGEIPYFVDAETLLQSDSVPFSFRDASEHLPHTFAGDYWLPSVQRVGMLPALHIVPDAASESGAVDYSALGYVSPGKVRSRRFVDVNTDGMTVAAIVEERSPGANIVGLGGNPIQPASYATEIVKGYEDAIECARKVIDRSTLEQFSGIRSRTIFRSTHLYARALWRSVQPDSLKSGVLHSLVFEPLAIPFCVDGGTPDRWGIFKEEVAQLENLDVPRFERDTSGRSLFCTSSNVEIHDFFSETGIESALQRAGFTPAELRRNVAIIKGALAASIEPQGVASSSCSTSVFADGDVAELRNAYHLIVEHILQTAVFTKKGSVNWVCKQKVPQSERFSYKPLGESFYNGRIGVACFLAAANRTMQDTRVQEVMSGVLREVTEIAHNKSWAKATANTLGGGITGAGGLLYALLCISQLTNDSKHIESAAILACEIKSSGVHRRWGMDFFDGKAGLLFSLARLQAASPDSRFEAAMTSCASLMLKELSSDGASRKTSGRGSSIPNGLAHGTAGVGLALVEAFSSTREDELADQGKTLLQAAFAEPIDRDMVMSQSVCRGTAGLSIAYTLASRIVNLPEVHGLESPTQLFISPDMTLCCGRAGQWLASNSASGQPRLFDNPFRKLPGLDALVDGYVSNDISLFRGLSGIGWALLERSGDSDIPGLFEFGTGTSSEMRDSALNQERES